MNISLNAFDQAGLNADWWIAESNPSGWSTFVYPTGWQTGINPCIQTPLFDLIPAFGVPNNQSPEGNKTFYFAVDNNADGNPNATWYDYVNLNVIDSIFPCSTTPIPKRDITIDGLADDWTGISPYIQDLQDDSSCGEGTDIKDLYLATDGSNLFWRIDTWSGKFNLENHEIRLKYTSLPNYPTLPKLNVQAGVTWNGEGGFIEVYNEIERPSIPVCSGSEYGRAGQIMEGKVPLRFFSVDDVDDIKSGQLSVNYYITPATYSEPPGFCDDLVDAIYSCK